jgi:EAL domain-containing protein (putative c-di-GMP-specific phosphodiesterase class I)/GGDEF domain-containing protein/DNA-binding NarL/FixJ family response regulator
MGWGATDMEDMQTATTLFAVSFRQRDEIAEILARARTAAEDGTGEGGRTSAAWDAVVMDNGDAIESRFLASGAAVAMIDARGAFDEGLAATRALGGIVATNGAALVVLVARDDVEAISRFFDGGATQVLVSPNSEGELVQALRFAGRHAARVSGSAVERRGAPGASLYDRETQEARRWIVGRIVEDRPIAVVLVSVSRLDIANAAHGRPAVGALIDAAVLRTETVAREAIGVEAMVARLGGSDFMLAVEASGTAVTAAITALDAALARPFAVADTRAVLGCRFGVAQRQPGDDSAALLRRASEALALAKASDGSVLHIALPDGVAPIDALAIDLHHAIERDEIDLRWQPQVEIASGKITGVEALARWNHRRLGPLGADTLFDAADRADLGIALSDHIQRLVLARAVAWPAALGTLRVSLNLTAADIARPGFAALFLARVDESGFPRGRLTIEITETGMIADLKAAAALLAELRGAGCRVAIDDFGTGYSSLAYLKSLPLDYVKIDKSLVRDIDGSPRDRVVVAGAITMARSLGLAVIAEGVETASQLELLTADGCNLYQGFLLSEPLREAALFALMRASAKQPLTPPVEPRTTATTVPARIG